jgi:HEAT repeat protein
MSLPKGPFTKVEFTPPDSAEYPEGRIIIDDKIIIKPKSRKYYFLIQIVAGLQKIFPKYRNGISPVDVLGYVEPVNKIKGIRRGIKKLGSLKGAWRGQIQGGKNLILYVKEKGKPEPRRLSSAEREEKKAFLMSQLFPAQEVSREYYFKINVDKPIDLLIETGFGKILTKGKKNSESHAHTTDGTPKSAPIIEKYIQRLSDDFRIRNIPFLGQYKDMIDKGVYIPRELLRQDGTSLQSREIFKPGLTPSDPYVQIVEKRRTLIEGDPGSGKTILIRNIALNLAQNFKTKHLIPLYVELRGYDPTPYKTLDSYAINIAAANARFTKEEELDFANSIRENEANLVFLLDGYDEAGTNPEIVKQQILSLPTVSKTVITSRKYSPTAGLTPDLRLELKPFDRRSQRSFVENAARVFSIQESVKDRLVMHIWGSSSFSDMARNPFFLLCICFAAASRKDVPSKRIDLLRHVQSGLLYHFINKISKQSPDSCKIIKYLKNVALHGINIFDSVYSKLAFYHLSKAEFEFPESSIVNFVEDVSREYNVSQYRLELNDAILNCGLLVTASLQGRYSFVHPIFMEYFAAKHLSTKTEWNDFVSKHYLNPFWRNVILFFIAQSGIPKFEEIYELLTCHDDCFLTGLFLAAESISEMEEYPLLTQEIIEKIYRIVEIHPFGEAMIGLLIERKSGRQFFHPKAHPLGTDRNLDRLVIESLVKRGAAPYLDACLGRIFSLPFDKVGAFKKLLCHYGKQIRPEILLDTFLNHNDQNLRQQCALALGAIAPDLAETKLPETLLKREEDLSIRQTCLDTLENVGSPRSAEALMRVLRDDTENPMLRVQCAWALGHLKWHEAVSVLVSVLAQTSDDSLVRQGCAYALGEIASPEVLAPLRRVFIHDIDGELRAHCANALGKCGNERDAKTIAKVLAKTNKSFKVRIVCAWALGQIRSPNSLPVLERILTHEDNPHLQAECARAITSIDQKRAKDILVPILDDPKAFGTLRRTCETLLHHIGCPQVDKL